MPAVRRLALLLALEGVALTITGIWYGVAGLFANADTAAIELAAAGAVLAGLVLLVLAVAADRGKAWSRSPAIVLNVFPFPLALSVLQAGAWWVAVPMVLLAGAVLYLYATPELREAFRERS
ncbi:MAG: hypothetical protein JWM02_2412 [Frankiales bacterium]|nr:hypothetical protein [Frankiales bacterium]